MPGVVFKKKAVGQMRPDWTLIGYSDCPQTTLDGHAYALDIHDNWDPTLTSAYQMFYQDYKIMYFPKNIDTSNLTNMQQMFKESNIEDLYIDASGVTGAGLNEICKGAVNLRTVDIEGVANYNQSVLTSLANSFQDCYALEEIDVSKEADRRPGIWYVTSITSIDHLCSGCRSLKEFSIVMGNGETALTNAGDAFRDCYNMEYLKVSLDGCNRFGCYEMGKNTASGTLCKIDVGSYNNLDGQYNFQGSKIAAGSHIQLERMSTTQMELFKNSTFDIDNTSWLWLDPSTTINALNMFNNATFPNGLSGMASLKIYNISNANSMFRSSKFTGSNKAIDFTSISFNNCTSFESMFNGSDVVTLTGNVDLTYATNLSYMFTNCHNLDNASVNNVLGWLIDASAYTGTKTLAAIGFTSADYPAATIQSLSNYSAFTAAGWSIGY